MPDVYALHRRAPGIMKIRLSSCALSILSRESCKTFAAIKTRSCVSASPLSAIHRRALRLHAGLLKIKKPQKAIGLSGASGGAQLAKIYRISFRPSLWLWLWLAAACTTPDLNYACSRDATFATRFAPPQNPFFVTILAAAPPTRQGKHTRRRCDGNFFLNAFFPVLLCYSRY
jgi:hypothetical protein